MLGRLLILVTVAIKCYPKTLQCKFLGNELGRHLLSNGRLSK